MNSYFYVDNIAKMLTARPEIASQHKEDVTKSSHFQSKKSFDFPFLLT